VTDAGKVICSLDALTDFADKMASASGKHWRKMAKTAAEARDTIDQLLRDLDAMERVRDGRAVKIIRRGVVMLNIDWWKRLLEAEEKNISAAVAASPLSGETRGEAAGWISVEDRLPDAAGYECLVCAVNENTHQTHVFTAFTGYGEPGWWTSNAHYMSRAKSPSDNRLHSALRVTHWKPLPELPEEYKND
jgi:hypothetical protein